MQKNTGRGFAREVAGVNLVEPGEVRWIGRAIDIALDHLRQRRAGSFQTQLHLLEHEFGLALERGRLDVADHGIERLYRDVRIFRIYEGTSQIQQVVIARETLKRGG